VHLHILKRCQSNWYDFWCGRFILTQFFIMSLRLLKQNQRAASGFTWFIHIQMRQSSIPQISTLLTETCSLQTFYLFPWKWLWKWGLHQARQQTDLQHLSAHHPVKFNHSFAWLHPKITELWCIITSNNKYFG
jgi:hypothetical protein